MSSNKHVAQVIEGPVAVQGPLIIQGLEFDPVNLELVGGHVAVDLTRAAMMQLTLSAATAIDNPTGKRPGTQFLIIITQDPATPRDITWGTDYEWGPNGAPDFSDDAVGAVTIVRGLVVSDTKVLLDCVAGDNAAGNAPSATPAANSVTTAMLQNESVTGGKILDDTIDSTKVQASAGFVFARLINIANANNDYSAVMPAEDSYFFLTAFFVKTAAAGGAGASMTVKRGAATIGAIAATGADGSKTDIASIDDTFTLFDPGETLTITALQGAGPTNVAGYVVALFIKA